MGIGVLGNSSTAIIEDASLVEGLKHNLLIISNLYSRGYKTSFNSLGCVIEHDTNKQNVFKRTKVDDFYMLYLDYVALMGG